jgi:hypothetical protein
MERMERHCYSFLKRFMGQKDTALSSITIKLRSSRIRASFSGLRRLDGSRCSESPHRLLKMLPSRSSGSPAQF